MSEIAKLIDSAKTFFNKSDNVIINNSLYVDFGKIIQVSPELGDYILDDFEEAIKVCEIAYEGISGKKNTSIRFTNIPQSEHKDIWKLRAKDVSKLVSITGYIRKTTEVTHFPKVIHYDCPSCGNTIPLVQLSEKITKPQICQCGNKTRFKETTRDLEDLQKLVIEEDINMIDPAQKPRTMLISLKGSLCHENIDKNVQPSKKIKVTGILKEKPRKDNSVDQIKYVEANNIEMIEEGIGTVKLSEDDIEEIKLMSTQTNFRENIIQEIYGTIYGHDIIKKALFLQLIGGEHLYINNKLEERGLIHVLICGNPGCMLKDQLIQTKDGLKKISEAKTCLTINDKFEKVESMCIPKCTGQKDVYIICTEKEELKCSKDHIWIVIRNKIIMEIKTNELKITDLLLRVVKNDEKYATRSNIRKKQYVGKFGFKLNKKVISRKTIICNTNRKNSGARSSCNNKKVKNDGHTYEVLQRTSKFRNFSKFIQIQRKRRRKKSGLQKWVKRGFKQKQKKVCKNSKRIFVLDLSHLWKKQYKNGLGYSSHRWEQQKQCSGQFNNSLSIMPCKITQLYKSKEKKEMWDLIVPDTHNFILDNGVITHNSGKTKLAKCSLHYLPNSRLSSGSSTTGVGLVAAITKDEELGCWVLEAGVLALSTGSLVVLDECDKLEKDDMAKLNNALMDLEVPFDKANIHSIIRTETTVLATANPVNRVFDKYEAVWKQIGFPKDFMDRFDLVFPMHAIETEEHQRKIIKTIFNKYNEDDEVDVNYNNEKILKYLAYVKNYVKPVMSNEAIKHITNEYIKLTKPANPGDEQAYFSSRLITNIIRVSTACAKSRLSKIIEVQDAEEAIEIFVESFKAQGIMTNDIADGRLNINAIEQIVPKKKRDKMYVLRECIDSCKNEIGISPHEEVLEKWSNLTGEKEIDFDGIINILVHRGDIIRPRPGFYKTI